MPAKYSRLCHRTRSGSRLPFATLWLLLSRIAESKSSYSWAFTTPFWYLASFARSCSRCIWVLSSLGTWKSSYVKDWPCHCRGNSHRGWEIAWMRWWRILNVQKWPRTLDGRRKHASRRARDRTARASCVASGSHDIDKCPGRFRSSNPTLPCNQKSASRKLKIRG